MPRVKPGERQRAKAPKVRTGCITCKIRRVKCDEGRPTCQRCTTTGRICDGYQQAPPPPPLLRAGALSPAPSPHPWATPAERRSLQFFAEQTAVQFGTFLPDDLWSVRMLQLAHSSGCVRHALVALSAYHERFRAGEAETAMATATAGGGEAHALRQYNLAIRALRDDPSLHLQLVSCTIFVCIEILRRNLTNAISLFKHGCALVRGASAADPSIDKVLRMIQAFFARIATQVFLVIGGDTKHSLAKTILPLLEESAAAAEEAAGGGGGGIASIAEAREWLLRLAVEYRRDMAPAAVTALSRKLGAWRGAFDGFRRSLAGRVLGPAERRALALLELHRRYLSINIAALEQEDREDPSAWDQWTDEFREMVAFAEEAGGVGDGEQQQQQQGKQQQPQHPRFYLEIGVLPALFFLCTKCRDPETRRRAIDIMARGKVQEGIWGSDMAARVARRVVALEGGLDGGVAAGEARVRRVEVAVDADAETLSVGYELRGGWVREMVEEMQDDVDLD